MYICYIVVRHTESNHLICINIINMYIRKQPSNMYKHYKHVYICHHMYTYQIDVRHTVVEKGNRT